MNAMKAEAKKRYAETYPNVIIGLTARVDEFRQS